MGEALLGSPPGEAVKSAANVLQAAQSQAIPLAYVDAGRLDVLTGLQISTQARAFIVDTVQKGYGVIVPERMVDWGGGEAIAWWQLDLATGEMVGVGEDGTHDFITFATMFMAGFLVILFVVWIIRLLWRLIQWRNAILMTWDHFWREEVPHAGGQGAERYENAFNASKRHMDEIREQVWEWAR